MRMHTHTTPQRGDLVMAAFDEGVDFTSPPREGSRLATRALMRMLGRSRKRDSGARSAKGRKHRAVRRHP
jgi:hypothetical protein